MRGNLPVLLTFALFLAACGRTDPSSTLASSPPQVVESSVEVRPNVSRFVKITCGQRCAAWDSTDHWGHYEKECAKWVTDCRDYAQSITLHATAADRAAGRIFREHPETGYQGCGIKAAQNVYHYFDRDRTQAAIRKEIDTIDIPASSQIATWPIDLERGMGSWFHLQQLQGIIDVDRHSGKNHAFIRRELADGYPVIALVYNGSHYVVVTGYDETKGFFILDYTGKGRWESATKLALEFDGKAEWASWAPGSSYDSGTVITFSRTPHKCQGNPSCFGPPGGAPGGEPSFPPNGHPK